ncbi:MAG: alpha/beta hydrolase [Oscillospiraceae bacterium]|nr:alpha/beta hydrolase [Oscillospiraceae bacterium]
MVDVKKKIEIGGVKQKIHYLSNDLNNPVLLFLHGGPGVCNRHTIIKDHIDLLDTFTMVTWDQRGSGGSFFDVPVESLTISRMTDDASELVDWCCKEFNKDKIFVIGGSWGSELGVLLCSKYPEKIAAFFGFGQVVDIAKNEEISFEYTREAAMKAGDMEAVKILDEVGPPVEGQYKYGYKGMKMQRDLMMKYGGYSKQAGKDNYWDAFVKPVILSGEYSFTDLIGFILGYKKVLTKMWPEIGKTCFPKTTTKIDVPIFIFDGRLDMNTPSVLVEDWFNMIEAPRKELIWFEESGHNPMGDEPEKFKSLLRERCKEIIYQNNN